LGTVNVVWRIGDARVIITSRNAVDYCSLSFPWIKPQINITLVTVHLKSKTHFCCFVKTVFGNRFLLLFSQFLFLKQSPKTLIYDTQTYFTVFETKNLFPKQVAKQAQSFRFHWDFIWRGDLRVFFLLWVTKRVFRSFVKWRRRQAKWRKIDPGLHPPGVNDEHHMVDLLQIHLAVGKQCHRYRCRQIWTTPFEQPLG